MRWCMRARGWNFLIYLVTVCDSVASTGVLRFVGPNSIRVWSFSWNSGHFYARILFSGIFRSVRNLFELDLLL